MIFKYNNVIPISKLTLPVYMRLRFNISNKKFKDRKKDKEKREREETRKSLVNVDEERGDVKVNNSGVK